MAYSFRSWTTEFKEQRATHNDKRQGHVRLDVDNEESSSGPRDDLRSGKFFLEPPPGWMKQKDEVERQMREIHAGMDSLQEMYTQLSQPSFLNDQTEDVSAKIEDETTALTSKLSQCSDSIKKVGTGFAISGECTEKLIAGIRNHLLMKLQQLAADFRASQQQYMDTITGRTKITRFVDNYKGNGTNSDSDSEEFLKQYQGEDAMKMEMLRQDRASIQKRDEQIRQLVKSTTEITTLFKEMADLVTTQGTILDRIDHNISSAVHYTREANEDLKKTNTVTSGMNKCWFILIAIIIVYTIIVCLIIRNHKVTLLEAAKS